MAKQQELKVQRNYYENPRRYPEFDENHRNDVTEFEPSRTKQADAESADINVILARHTAMEISMMGERDKQIYGDFSDVGSFQEALQIVDFANQQFMGLDAQIRARFGNDPAKFLEFVGNPENLPEMVKMGLATAKPEETTPPSPSAKKVKGKDLAPPTEPKDD